MKHSISARNVIMGTVGLTVLSALSGCQGNQEESESAKADTQN